MDCKLESTTFDGKTLEVKFTSVKDKEAFRDLGIALRKRIDGNKAGRKPRDRAKVSRETPVEQMALKAAWVRVLETHEEPLKAIVGIAEIQIQTRPTGGAGTARIVPCPAPS